MGANYTTLRPVRTWALVLVLAACAEGRTVEPASPIEARYRLARDGRHAPAVATSVYRDFLGKSPASRCRMVPTDSEMFDVRSRRCGSLLAAVAGISRLLLETAGSPRFLRPLRMDGRLRWWDLPGRDPCDL